MEEGVCACLVLENTRAGHWGAEQLLNCRLPYVGAAELSLQFTLADWARAGALAVTASV